MTQSLTPLRRLIELEIFNLVSKLRNTYLKVVNFASLAVHLTQV